MNGLRIVHSGGWFTATTPDLPLVAGYGKTEAEAVERLRLEIEAREMNLQDELDRVRRVRAEWKDAS